MLTCDPFFNKKNVKIRLELGNVVREIEGLVVDTNSSCISVEVKKTSCPTDYPENAYVFIPFGLSFTMVTTEQPENNKIHAQFNELGSKKTL